MSEHVKFQVHHVRFFSYQPRTINCIAHDDTSCRVAVSRADASVEIMNTKDNWVQEMVFPGSKDASIEALVWCEGRLFAGGISGNVVEFDLATQLVKTSVSSNAGPVWCLTRNAAGDQLAAGTEDGCVVLFDVSGDLQFMRSLGKQEGRLLSIAWYNSDGENVLVAGGINNIRQWSVKSGQPISRMTLGRKFQKQTIVWCIAVTKDFTIISGDSRGVVTFWNGKESTQLKTFHCHKADVLSLCLSEDGTKAFSGGVDAELFQFSLYSADPNTERKRWVHQLLHNKHTHDIRALSYREPGDLASGGVDTVVFVAKLRGKPSVLEVAPIPALQLVHVASERNLIQIQYGDYIEVWRLGAANTPFAAARGMLPLTQNRVKLLVLRARSGHQILCSTIANNGNLAFSDTKGVRVFQLTLENETSGTPTVSLEQIRSTFGQPARLLTLTPDGSHLLAVLTSSAVKVMNVETGEVKRAARIESESMIHRLAASPDNRHFAVATLDHGVHIYDVITCQHLCSCPVQTTQVSALAFSPHSPMLLIAYGNQAVYEFDIEKKEYSQWSRNNSDKFPKFWLKSLLQILHIAFVPDNPNKIVLQTSSSLAVLDKTSPISISESRPHSDRNRPERLKLNPAHRICYKYKYLMHADFTSSGMLVAVERPPSEIEDNLPPPFKQKKFGTS